MKRILFVDDEPAVLDGLRTMLRKNRAEWEMDFVESGAAAITAMERHPYDLLCSDMRMPKMDGAELLTIVSERWPQTVRIVLSGYSELAQTIRLVPIAHQYLSKPCDPKQIQTVIARCLSVHELLNAPQLRALVGSMRSLPTMPKTYQRLRQAMTDPDVSAAEISKIIGSDAAVAAKVLQVVNSAFFRLARRITRIDQAVSYLGFFALRNLVLSTEVFGQYPTDVRIGAINADQIQERALKTMGVLRALTRGLPLSDDAIVVGLLHDIGYLIFMQTCPDKLKDAYSVAANRKIPMPDAEKEVIGASHAAVGAYLLALWGLPYTIVDAVAHHHAYEHATQGEFDLLNSLILAESLLHEFEPEGCGAMALDAAAFERLGAQFSLEEARSRVASVLNPERSEV